MYCSGCGKVISEGAQFCSECGRPVASSTLSIQRRPIAGIAVGTIFGIIGVVWSIAALFAMVYMDPGSIETSLNEAFPGLDVINFFGSSVGFIANTVLLIGVLLAFLRHPNGHKTVRITAYCALVASFFLFMSSYFTVTGADAWQYLDPPTRGSLMGGLIGGMIGGLFQWILLLFLFRKRRWP